MQRENVADRCVVMLILLIMLCDLTACSPDTEQYNLPAPSDATEVYKVYLSDDFDSLPDNISSDLLVIDGQYFTDKQITALHQNNKKIYSYLNIGSLESFRDYYNQFKNLEISAYENWDNEYWIDVTEKKWQLFIAEELGPSLLGKGIDGFFIDNTDLYYNYPEADIYDSLVYMIKELKKTDAGIIINGGDYFLTEYLSENGTFDDLLDGVNQECVFTAVNWEDGKFLLNDKETTDYFLNYLSSVSTEGKKVYIIEYCDGELAARVESKCKKTGYSFYIADSLSLD